MFYLLQLMPSKIDVKWFSFHCILKALLVLKIFEFFFLTFWCYNTHIANISRSKDSQTCKFGQLIEYNKRTNFLYISCRNLGRRTISKTVVFKKSFIRGKSQWYAAYFQHILIALDLVYNKNKLYKTLDYWSRVMLNFDFLESVGKCLGIDSLPHVQYDFSRKMFFYVMFF